MMRATRVVATHTSEKPVHAEGVGGGGSVGERVWGLK